MIERLAAYQNFYNTLSVEDRRGYIKRMDKDADLKKELFALAKFFLHKTRTTCGWCLIEYHTLLMRLNPETMADNNIEYALRAGTLLHDPINKDVREVLTPQTLTEERALRHLAYNPKARLYFTRLPEDINKRIEKYLSNDSAETSAPVAQTTEETAPETTVQQTAPQNRKQKRRRK